MSVINVNEIKKEIAKHQAEIDKLNSILELASGLGESSNKKRGRPTSKKRGSTQKKSKGLVKKPKRGAIAAKILELVAASKKPIPTGDIRKALIEAKLISPDSGAIYSQLQQMAKRGTVSKNAKGYSSAVTSSASKVAKKSKAKTGKSKKAKK